MTAGADSGAGPNSSVLSQPAMSQTQTQYQSAKDLITTLAMRNPSSPAVQLLAAKLQRTF